jgi:hypothetical protein
MALPKARSGLRERLKTLDAGKHSQTYWRVTPGLYVALELKPRLIVGGNKSKGYSLTAQVPISFRATLLSKVIDRVARLSKVSWC